MTKDLEKLLRQPRLGYWKLGTRKCCTRCLFGNVLHGKKHSTSTNSLMFILNSAFLLWMEAWFFVCFWHTAAIVVHNGSTDYMIACAVSGELATCHMARVGQQD